MKGAAVTYGSSLYELAAGEGMTQEFLDELKGVCEILKTQPDYSKLLSEPAIPKKERTKLIEEAFGGRVHEYIKSFLKILCENGTIGELPACMREYVKRYNADNGIVTAAAVSAIPLTAEQAERLREKLCSLTGKNVEMTCKVDPSAIGGIRIDIEGRRLDGTVSERLKAVNAVLNRIDTQTSD